VERRLATKKHRAALKRHRARSHED
jgi:hypothetical protein